MEFCYQLAFDIISLRENDIDRYILTSINLERGKYETED